MLHRQDPEGLILISQPAHAWISGQIARHWGNSDFSAPTEEVCLAAALHDIGFLAWEESPTLDPATGLPHDFLHMPPDIHLDLWRTGIRHLLRFGRYPALLVSLHFTNITRQNWVTHKNKTNGLLDAYLKEQESLQTTLLTSLQNDFYYGADLTEARVTRDQQLVSIFDWLSLLACLTPGKEKIVPEVPAKEGLSPLTLTPVDRDGHRIRIAPWPFSVPKLELVCEGRRLLKTFQNQEEMREALKAASRLTLVTEFVREG